MMAENFELKMEEEIENIKAKKQKPTLLLHCCCAPCSTAVIERISDVFKLKLYFYNPNIYPAEEYQKRLNEFDKLLSCPDFAGDIELLPSIYQPEEFERKIEGLQNEKEGGKRCEKCFYLRLFETARKAKEIGADYFCTTLTVSPHKNAAILNEIGLSAQEKYKVKFLHSDFKKKDGFKRSTELSNKLGLYRQNYCGCRYSIWF